MHLRDHANFSAETCRKLLTTNRVPALLILMALVFACAEEASRRNKSSRAFLPGALSDWRGVESGDF
jgi:hypothetical protein